ncbi:MAG: VCBS repeat-containing protein [Planctomycetes bacterium]|nr:VCBS repeat-containing protein [Planctomycetota bacterium]
MRLEVGDRDLLLLQEWDGPAVAEHDLDGDGVPDYGVQDGNPLIDHEDHYRMRVHSGHTGEVLWERFGEQPKDGFGLGMNGIGDADGDGRNDLIVGTPGTRVEGRVAGKLYVLRGQDGREIYTLTTGLEHDGLGVSSVVMPDFDGDGVKEFVVSAIRYPVRGVPGGGRVSLHSGRTGQLLWEQFGIEHDHSNRGAIFSGDAFGYEMASAGDADAYGYPDLIVYSTRFALAGANWGRVHLISGRTGEVLAAYESEWDDSVFGRTLAGIGDTDGDGRAELVIGAREFDLHAPDPLDPFPIVDVGRAYVVSYRPDEKRFIRGDADADGDVDITDAITILLHLFAGGPAPCLEAMDINRYYTGVNVADASHLASFLFLSGWTPEPPYPDCARFETLRDRLPCERSACE